MRFLFSIFQMSLIFTGRFMPLKSQFWSNSLPAIVILHEIESAGFKYLNKLQLKHSLS